MISHKKERVLLNICIISHTQKDSYLIVYTNKKSKGKFSHFKYFKFVEEKYSKNKIYQELHFLLNPDQLFHIFY